MKRYLLALALLGCTSATSYVCEVDRLPLEDLELATGECAPDPACATDDPCAYGLRCDNVCTLAIDCECQRDACDEVDPTCDGVDASLRRNPEVL